MHGEQTLYCKNTGVLTRKISYDISIDGKDYIENLTARVVPEYALRGKEGRTPIWALPSSLALS